MCPLGTWVSCAGKVRCDACMEGRYCPTVTESLLCPAGFFCPASTYVPIPCPAGTHCFVGAKVPAQCGIGQYGPFPQQESCLPCPGSTSVGESRCPVVRRRALLASDGPGETAAGRAESPLAATGVAEAAASEPAGGHSVKVNSDVHRKAAAMGYAGCTMGVLLLSALAVRRTAVVQNLKQSSAVGPDACADEDASDAVQGS